MISLSLYLYHVLSRHPNSYLCHSMHPSTPSIHPSIFYYVIQHPISLFLLFDFLLFQASLLFRFFLFVHSQSRLYPSVSLLLRFWNTLSLSNTIASLTNRINNYICMQLFRYDTTTQHTNYCTQNITLLIHSVEHIGLHAPALSHLRTKVLKPLQFQPTYQIGLY